MLLDDSNVGQVYLKCHLENVNTGRTQDLMWKHCMLINSRWPLVDHFQSLFFFSLPLGSLFSWLSSICFFLCLLLCYICVFCHCQDFHHLLSYSLLLLFCLFHCWWSTEWLTGGNGRGGGGSQLATQVVGLKRAATGLNDVMISHIFGSHMPL